MKISLVGAELEENLGLRYIASALENKGHIVEIVPFNSESDIPNVVKQVTNFSSDISGLSMVFTSRGKEFCRLARSLRDSGYRGHINAGGHFAALNCESLLKDFPAFDSVALGEGEDILCSLAENLGEVSKVSGLCYRQNDGTVKINTSTGNPDNLDALPFPKRSTFHEYFGKPIASILSSRGCWRNCAFCSINAWYKQGGGRKFRIRSVENIIAEMKELYFNHGIRIFNFQDDNFFLPNHEEARLRFEALRDGLQKEGVQGIAIAIKARPDSITNESVRVLDDLGLFRVFLGVENASENGLRKLNRKCTFDQILNSLKILNDFDVHIAYNLLMFEPDTVLDDILINLRFMERHMDNPFNFCRAEAYAGTGLEEKLLAEGRLLGDYFGIDYRLKDPKSEAFHQIANYAFFDRNFNDAGLHYFNMQVDFYFQLLRRFYPEVLTQTLRGNVRNFIKQTNLDTYQCLCEIYDFVADADPANQGSIQGFARQMRQRVDTRSKELHAQGESIVRWLNDTYELRGQGTKTPRQKLASVLLPFPGLKPVPYYGLGSIDKLEFIEPESRLIGEPDLFGITPSAIPYDLFKNQMERQKVEGR
ncbi:MAG: B12-binding domain-containing radical SAM protein [Candidatus Methanoperedens sp.]|nr:B12-binding domain-containing radical SAM protein [Candidatus Methanoperedens sp.]MCE8427838.1 B12-binding domain-containing radical SAM protein [Candidatus Methanoperedens sp.]